MSDQTCTTIHLHESVKERLEMLKPYPSMSYNDLLIEMADTYEDQSSSGKTEGT